MMKTSRIAAMALTCTAFTAPLQAHAGLLYNQLLKISGASYSGRTEVYAEAVK